MFESEEEFQQHVIELLQPSRESIEEEYRPFEFVTLTVDIKSLFRRIEEWRELKILYYGDSKRNIQNLWKGIGKVRLMQRLAQKYLTNNELPIFNILTLPQSDFSRLMNEIQAVLLELVPLETVSEGEVLSVNKFEPFIGASK